MSDYDDEEYHDETSGNNEVQMDIPDIDDEHLDDPAPETKSNSATEASQNQSKDVTPPPASKKSTDSHQSLSVNNADGERRRPSLLAVGTVVRSASSLRRRSDFADDTERERAHLKDANEKLAKDLEKMQKELDSLKKGRHGGELSEQEQRSKQEVEDENAAIEADIKKLREKLTSANDVEMLDTMEDTLAQRQIQVKTLELKKRNLQDESHQRGKVMDRLDRGPNPQALFLDLKAERKRHADRIEKTRVKCEKLREAIDAMKKKADEEQAKEAELGIANVDKQEMIALQKRDAEQRKQITLLQRKVGVLGGTFDARNKHMLWHAKDLCEDVKGLQEEIRHWEEQIQRLEQTIMQNKGLTQKPPHFLEPMNLKTLEQPSPPKARPPAKSNPHTARVKKHNQDSAEQPTESTPRNQGKKSQATEKPQLKKNKPTAKAARPKAKPQQKQKKEADVPPPGKADDGAAFSASSSSVRSRSRSLSSSRSYHRRSPTPSTPNYDSDSPRRERDDEADASQPSHHHQQEEQPGAGPTVDESSAQQQQQQHPITPSDTDEKLRDLDDDNSHEAEEGRRQSAEAANDDDQLDDDVVAAQDASEDSIHPIATENLTSTDVPQEDDKQPDREDPEAHDYADDEFDNEDN